MSNEKTKKKLFGRNLFTLIFIILCAGLLYLIIFIPTTYIKEYNNNKVTPFITGEPATTLPEESQYTHVNYIKQNELKELDLTFECKEYTEIKEAGKASFEIKVKKNDNTDTLMKGVREIKLGLCLAANWVNFCVYASTYQDASPSDKTITLNTIASSNGAKANLYIKNLINFPAKNSNTFPIPVTVDSANAYLMLSYTMTQNGKEHNYFYVIEYTYQEYHTKNTAGSR